METSSPNYPIKVARFRGPCYDLSQATSANLDFRYHMRGTNMGTLILEIPTDNGSTWTNVWHRSGNQGTSWQNKVVDLSGSVGSTIIRRGIHRYRYRCNGPRTLSFNNNSHLQQNKIKN